jgi:uncharacterized BrkB/YihY/UPF0761 family membrane protein
MAGRVLTLKTKFTSYIVGAAGSFVIVLAWIYDSTQVLNLGTNFASLPACRVGSLIATDLRRSVLNAES